MDYLSRYEAFLQKKQVPFVRQGDLILREYGKIIIPLGPAKQKHKENHVDAKKAIKKLKGYLLWYAEYDPSLKESEWYAIIKNKYQAIEEYSSSKMRNKIRKGLKHCEIKRVEVSWLMENGADVYYAATKDFINKTEEHAKSDFKREIATTLGFDDIIQYWGVFIEQKLVGYTVIYLYEKLEANMSEIRINPEYNKYRPSYALLHKISEEYLFNRGFEYINNGYRNLVHETNIQNLLLNEFGYEKLPLKLNLKYKPFIALFIKVLYLFRRAITLPPLHAVLLIEQIAIKQKKLPK